MKYTQLAITLLAEILSCLPGKAAPSRSCWHYNSQVTRAHMQATKRCHHPAVPVIRFVLQMGSLVRTEGLKCEVLSKPALKHGPRRLNHFLKANHALRQVDWSQADSVPCIPSLICMHANSLSDNSDNNNDNNNTVQTLKGGQEHIQPHQLCRPFHPFPNPSVLSQMPP